MEFYDKGAIANPHHGKNIIKLGLTAREKTDLVAIRKAFTGKMRVLSTRPKPPGTWSSIVPHRARSCSNPRRISVPDSS